MAAAYLLQQADAINPPRLAREHQHQICCCCCFPSPPPDSQTLHLLLLHLLFIASISRLQTSTCSSPPLCLPLTCLSPLAISAAAHNPSPDPTPSYPPINVSFPFGTQPQCGASSSFRLSNDCQHQDLRWLGFMDAINVSTDLPEPPFVLGIGDQSDSCVRDGFVGSVDIAWNLSLAALREDNNATSYRHLICNPPSVHQLPQYFGSISRINLHRLQVIRGNDDSSLVLDSDSTQLLLFNCTAPASQIDESTWERNGSACQNYTQNQDCDSDDTVKKLEATKCVRLRPCNNKTHRSIDVGGWMNEMNCSHFQINSSTSWSDSPQGGAALGTMRLRFNASHPLCPNCTRSGGECGYENVTSLENFQCHCSDGRHDPLQCRPFSSGRCGTKCKTALKVCIPVAAVCIVAMAVILLISLRRRRLRNRIKSRSVLLATPPHSSNKLWTHRALALSSKFGPVSVKEFSYQELADATSCFSDDNIVGDGGFGAVYLGFLESGQKVAIKMLYHDNFQRLDQFYNEIRVLSSFQHPNLIKLHGFCCQDSRDLLLVFEYASNGTVWDQLHGNEDEDGEEKEKDPATFGWEIRLRVACETAEALSYMHNSLENPIYHRDVKTANILLDDDFHAKLADFGLSRLMPGGATHITTIPQGSPGYVDPDYHHCYRLTDKSDVYSFGVVLVELVSAQPAVDMSRNKGEINLSAMASAKMSRGAWTELVDPSLHMDRHPDMEISVKSVLDLAFTCLHAEKDDRPTMKQVAETLKKIRSGTSGYGDDDDDDDDEGDDEDAVDGEKRDGSDGRRSKDCLETCRLVRETPDSGSSPSWNESTSASNPCASSS